MKLKYWAMIGAAGREKLSENEYWVHEHGMSYWHQIGPVRGVYFNRSQIVEFKHHRFGNWD